MRIILLCLLFPALLTAQSLDGGMASRAGVPDLTTRSSLMFRHNPAILGPKHRCMTTFDFLSFHGAAGNNAFSVNSWNDEIARDHYLTEQDKQSILDHIPDDGLEINVQGSVPLLGLTYNKMAAALTVESALRAKASEDLFELALRGNELNRSYHITDFEGEQYSLLDVAVGFVYEFDQETIPGLYAGVGFHFYQGLSYETVAEAEGELLITDSLITGYSVLHRERSERGDGVGFDLGGLAVLNDKWQLGLTLRQIGAKLQWEVNENEFRYFETDSSGIIVDSLDEEGYLDRAFHSENVTLPGGTTQSELPAILEAAAHFQATKIFGLMSMLRYRTITTAQGEHGLEAGIGGEIRPTSWLPLNAGISAGGPFGWQLGFGGGLSFRNYELRFGWTWNRGVLDSAKGIGFGISQQIRF